MHLRRTQVAGREASEFEKHKGIQVVSAPAKPVLMVELALLGLLALLWGSSYLFIKVAVTEIPPVTLVARGLRSRKELLK